MDSSMDVLKSKTAGFEEWVGEHRGEVDMVVAVVAVDIAVVRGDFVTLM
jgi:hypothetical protein